MRVLTVTPPDPLVDWEDARVHLRLDDDSTEQDYVETLIDAACAMIDGPRGCIGRAIGIQTLELRLNAFLGFDCFGGIKLPCPDIISVESVTYVDTSGVSQEVPSASYALADDIVSPSWGLSWPSTRFQGEAVRIRYQTGCVADPAVSPLQPAIPAPVRAAVLLMVGDLYSNRQTVETGVRAAAVSVPMSTTVETLLAPYRVFG